MVSLTEAELWAIVFCNRCNLVLALLLHFLKSLANKYPKFFLCELPYHDHLGVIGVAGKREDNAFGCQSVHPHLSSIRVFGRPNLWLAERKPQQALHRIVILPGQPNHHTVLIDGIRPRTCDRWQCVRGSRVCPSRESMPQNKPPCITLPLREAHLFTVRTTAERQQTPENEYNEISRGNELACYPLIDLRQDIYKNRWPGWDP